MATTTTDLPARVTDFYGQIDAGEHEVIDRLFAPDARMEFNDVPPVTGSAEIRGFVDQWKSGFRSVTHDIYGMSYDRDQAAVTSEISVTYVFPNGDSLDVRGCVVTRFRDALIIRWSIYVDVSRLS